MKPPVLFELCAETLEACVAAHEGGADRIELCADLAVGGLTPSGPLIAAAVKQSGLPVHVILRPHAESFCYSADSFEIICEDLQRARRFGASGVVCGVLNPDGTVDTARTRELVLLAAPMKFTFHRAFDETPDLSRALEDVIATGCHRILTSGGAAEVVAGALVLARLVEQAGERIAIAVGGGLRLENAQEVARITQANHFHGSLQRTTDAGTREPVTADDVRAMVQMLQVQALQDAVADESK